MESDTYAPDVVIDTVVGVGFVGLVYVVLLAVGNGVGIRNPIPILLVSVLLYATLVYVDRR